MMAAYKRLVSIRQLYALSSALTLGPTIEITRTLQYLALLKKWCLVSPLRPHSIL